MITTYDELFDLIAPSHVLPAGWGFPAVRPKLPDRPAAAKIREALFPFSDDEGKAQLIRWYYGIVSSYPALAMGIFSGKTVYQPGLAWKPPVAIQTEAIRTVADPTSGILRMGWKPGRETDTLTGTIEVGVGTMTLTLGSRSWDLPFSVSFNGDLSVVWPQELQLQMGFNQQPLDSFGIIFRPNSFDAESILAGVSPLIPNSTLIAAGLASAWEHATAVEKLAMAWVIIHKLNYVQGH